MNSVVFIIHAISCQFCSYCSAWCGRCPFWRLLQLYVWGITGARCLLSKAYFFTYHTFTNIFSSWLLKISRKAN